MESLSFYLKATVSKELEDLYTAALSYFDTFGVDIHISMIDSLLAAADDRDSGEVLAFLDSIVFDQVNAILLAHRMDVYPQTMAHACDYLRSLDYYQSLGGDAFVIGTLEASENPEDTWGELVAYACNSQAEDYLDEIRRVDIEALAAIEAVVAGNDATEDEDYDEDTSDSVRQHAVPWVKERLMAYREKQPEPSILVLGVIEQGMKLGLPVETLWGALNESVLDLPEDRWPHELVSVALGSRLEESQINEWVSDTLSRYTDNPLVTKSAQQIMHQRIHPTE